MKVLFYEPREGHPTPPTEVPVVDALRFTAPPFAVSAPVEDLPWYLWRVDKKNNVVKR